MSGWVLVCASLFGVQDAPGCGVGAAHVPAGVAHACPRHGHLHGARECPRYCCVLGITSVLLGVCERMQVCSFEFPHLMEAIMDVSFSVKKPEEWLQERRSICPLPRFRLADAF